MKKLNYKIPDKLKYTWRYDFYFYLYHQYPSHHRSDFLDRDGFLDREITVLELDNTVIIQVVGSPARHVIIVNQRQQTLLINGHVTKPTRKQGEVINRVLSFADRVIHIPQLVAV